MGTDPFGREKKESSTPEAFGLTEFERQSPLWKRLMERNAKRLALLRSKNDNDKDAVATARLRGQIRELKNFAALDNPAQQTEADDS